MAGDEVTTPDEFTVAMLDDLIAQANRLPSRNQATPSGYLFYPPGTLEKQLTSWRLLDVPVVQEGESYYVCAMGGRYLLVESSYLPKS